MRVLVATLKTIENEFESSRDMIAKQSYSKIEHIVYENLPNAEAHIRLFQDFVDKKDQYDLLIKVDADTILRDEHAVQDIVNRFQEDESLEHVQYRLFDFFTDKPIWGLNCYRNTIELREQDSLFVDRFVVGKPEKRLFLEHEIMGLHSPNPSAFQALHFGFHRQLKKQYPQVILPMLKVYLRTWNRKRALALVGTVLVQQGKLGSAHNRIYQDDEIVRYSEQFSKRSSIFLFCYILTNYSCYFLRKLKLWKEFGKS